MPSLIQGRIVYCRKPVPDPNGRNPKPNRPFVIITRFEDIDEVGTVQGAAITGETTLSPAEHYYQLPTGPGAIHHGCTPGSAVLCTWIRDLEQSDLEVSNKCLRPKDVYRLIEKVKQVAPGKFKERSTGEPKDAEET